MPLNWSEPNSRISQVSIGSFVSKTITWSKPNFRPTMYRVVANDFPANSLSITADNTGVHISGTVASPWGYIRVKYLDLNGNVVTLNNLVDILSDMPPPAAYQEIIEVIVDSTVSQNFYFTVEVDWEELNPGTQTPKVPAVVGTASATYYYTVTNNWSMNASSLDILMKTKKLQQSGGLPNAQIFGDGPFGVGTFGV